MIWEKVVIFISMKRLLFILLLFPVFVMGKRWINVGSPAFSAGATLFTSMAIHTNGMPYVVYSDSAYGYAATVMKFDGSNWVTVGNPGFSAAEIQWTSIAIDAGGIPYVAYSDAAYGRKATVMKFDGTSWVNVGSAGFSDGLATTPSIALSATGTPYVIYGDYGDTINVGSATVMKFNGISWVTVGSPRFSTGMDWGWKWIAIDGSGTPYMVYENGSSGEGPVSVMKFDGSNWVTVGSPNFSAGNVRDPSIVIDRSGTPYVAYQDCANGYAATAMKYVGGIWENVGSAGFSEGGVYTTSIALDNNGTPYVAYLDEANGQRATVMKNDAEGSWINVGSTGFSLGKSFYTSLAIDGRGIPYVAFRDEANGSKATVMKFDTSTVGIDNILSDNIITTFPNPATSQLTITASNRINTIAILNLLGQVVYNNKYTNKQAEVDISALAAGIYLVKVNEVEVRKFVKQ